MNHFDVGQIANGVHELSTPMKVLGSQEHGPSTWCRYLMTGAGWSQQRRGIMDRLFGWGASDDGGTERGATPTDSYADPQPGDFGYESDASTDEVRLYDGVCLIPYVGDIDCSKMLQSSTVISVVKS